MGARVGMTAIEATPPPHRLPDPPTPILGREQAVTSLVERLNRPGVRLLTLTGPGGVGKTRLALAVAAELAEGFPDGVVFVNLAPIADPDLVAPAVAHALGVHDAGLEPPTARLREFLRGRRLLLVLDNFEHVLDAAPLATDLLGAAPGLRILATSRARLRLSGEHEQAVPPLGLADHGEHATLDAAARSPAVQLFVARAQAVQDAFVLTAENAAAVAAICRRLDGLPLAIELAAARVKVLPPVALLARLDRRLPLLTAGGRDLPARQQTMRDAIAWSYGLLPEPEQRLFRRLAVFVGGCTIEAAEAVANPSGDLGIDPFEGIASLVEASLLRREPGPGPDPRFTMLETVREFGLERLAAAGEFDEAHRRHADRFLALAEHREPTSFFYVPVSGLDRLAADHDNLGAAFDWLYRRGAIEACLRLAAACAPYWFARGHLREGAMRLHAALALAGSTPSAARGCALNAAANLAIVMGEFRASAAFSREALAVWNAVGDPGGRAAALFDLARVAEVELQWDEAADLFDQAASIYRGLGQAYELGRALALRGGGGVRPGRPRSGRPARGRGGNALSAPRRPAMGRDDRVVSGDVRPCRSAVPGSSPPLPREPPHAHRRDRRRLAVQAPGRTRRDSGRNRRSGIGGALARRRRSAPARHRWPPLPVRSPRLRAGRIGGARGAGGGAVRRRSCRGQAPRSGGPGRGPIPGYGRGCAGRASQRAARARGCGGH